MSSEEFEKNSDKFNLSDFLAARDLLRLSLQQIAEQVTAGINEKEGIELVRNFFQQKAITKFWHPTKFRIGADTTKNFRDLSDPELRLKQGEIFFIDIGPIIKEHEADFAESFILGAEPLRQDYHRLLQTTRQVWTETSRLWREQNLSGPELYRRASHLAETQGYRLNNMMGGHRLGDFPHALHCKLDLNEVELVPKPHLWVLEIQLIDDKIQRGAFFEDLLF